MKISSIALVLIVLIATIIGLSIKHLDEKNILILDQNEEGLPDSLVVLTYRCKMPNVVDSATWTTVKSFSTKSNKLGIAQFKSEFTSKPLLAFDCDNFISVSKNGYTSDPDAWFNARLKSKSSVKAHPDTFNLLSSQGSSISTLHLTQDFRTIKLVNIALWAQPKLEDILNSTNPKQKHIRALELATEIGPELYELLPTIDRYQDSRWPQKRIHAANALRSIQSSSRSMKFPIRTCSRFIMQNSIAAVERVYNIMRPSDTINQKINTAIVGGDCDSLLELIENPSLEGNHIYEALLGKYEKNCGFVE